MRLYKYTTWVPTSKRRQLENFKKSDVAILYARGAGAKIEWLKMKPSFDYIKPKARDKCIVITFWKKELF